MYVRAGDSFREISRFLESVPVIETHEHYTGIMDPVEDVLSFIIRSYFRHDLSSCMPEAEGIVEKVADPGIPFGDRYEMFELLYKKTCYTGYARGMQKGLEKCWGLEKIDKESITRLAEKLKKRDQKFYYDTMSKYGIKAKIVNTVHTDIDVYLNKKRSDYTELCRFAFPLPKYHNIHGYSDISQLGKAMEANIISLDGYMKAFESYLKRCVDFGIVCIKDQTAYRRVIKYSYPERGEAEKIFNKIISNPRDIFGDNEVRALDDWLFHQFMQLAHKYGLPVQLHTGHMAGIRNDIVKANASNLTSVIEMYKEVKFDLFHGNWPYMGELLFLGKNYPNVWIDLCWVQAIDPLYCVELMKRAVMTVPHSKIMAFGGDSCEPEWTVGFLIQARENTAAALSEMTDSGFLSINESKQIALDWFFNNPNEFFKLGFEPLKY